MLPISYFERLSAAWQLRTYEANRERRGGVRVDMRGKAYMCQMSGQVASEGHTVKMREISRTGGSLLTQRRLRNGQEVLLRVRGRGDGTEYWMWCRCKRCSAIDDIFIVGFTFLKLLYPGHSLAVGTRVSTLLWLDVEGDKVPEDPYEGEARVA